jgi:hypothetical protein
VASGAEQVFEQQSPFFRQICPPPRQIAAAPAVSARKPAASAAPPRIRPRICRRDRAEASSRAIRSNTGASMGKPSAQATQCAACVAQLNQVVGI